MFSEPVGNLLQLLALGLELVGILLAAIELRYPKIAKAIMDQAKGIKFGEDDPGPSAHDRWLSMSYRDFLRGDFMEEQHRRPPWAPLIVLWGIFTLFFVVRAVVFGDQVLIAENTTTLIAIYIGVPIVLGIGTPTLIYIAARIVNFTRTFTEDRGLGSIGLLIAGVGLLLEAYQVITVALSDQPSISQAPFSLQVLVSTIGFLLLIFLIYMAVVIRFEARQRQDDGRSVEP